MELVQRMANPHRRERVTGDEPFKPRPIEGFALASAIKMAKQNSLGLAVELIHRLASERHRIVLDVPPQLGSEHAPQFFERQHIPHLAGPFTHPLELTAQALPARLQLGNHGTTPRPAQVKRESEKVKAILLLTPPLGLLGKPL